MTMRRQTNSERTGRLWLVAAAFLALAAVWAPAARAQGFGDPVFSVELQPDRQPFVAGEPYRLAVVVTIDDGWHVNSEDPGDEFAVPTALEWNLPDGWQPPVVHFPEAQEVTFSFSPKPLRVWEGRAVLIAEGTVPVSASGHARLAVTVTAQACNNAQCLPPTPVEASVSVGVMKAGATSRPVNAALFEGKPDRTASPPAAAGTAATAPAATAVAATAASKAPQRAEHAASRPEATPEPEPSGKAERLAERLAGSSLPLQLGLVFLLGLGLAFTPCVYPLIPITVGFFTQQAKDRKGGSFLLALVYVLGIAITYSSLGVAAALTGRLFGSALQSPVVVIGIALVMLALAASMFGLWELRVPAWAMNMAGTRQGYLGSLIMGLLVGVVAAPCVGPAVVGLLTYVGQRQDPVLGFALFFALSLGLGLPYLVLGTFSGALNRMPSSGAWMIGVRKVFGVLLVALAAYFIRPLLPDPWGTVLIGLSLLLGGLYLLVIDRTAADQPGIDRAMRLVSAALIAAGVLLLPGVSSHHAGGVELEWQPWNDAAFTAAVDSGKPVIVDFFATWCAPCRELDEITFSDPAVAAELEAYARFKVDLTKSNEANDALRKRFDVRGVPTVIVYRDRKERFRITGFEKPERFLARLGRQ